MLKFKCKVMLIVLPYFILNFLIVYSHDIENVQHIQKRYKQERKGVCDFHKQSVSFNYNELYKKDAYTFTSNDKIFYLNICGYAPQCGRNTAVCYKNKTNSSVINNIGLFNEIFYPHEAIRYKINKKKKTTIHFICGRHLKEPNITYESGSSYIFKFVTSKACYPKPTECVFTDQKYNYNISSLNRNKNNWIVQNVPNSNGYKIYLNICGKFNSIPNLKANSDCFYDGTQICLVNNDGDSKNLGVFSDSFQFRDDSLLLTITGGSLCNGSNSITTNIEFICSIDELGPVLVSNSKCEYNIKWMTPTACPHHTLETSNCVLKGLIFGYRNMEIKSESIQLNTSILKYDVCDRIRCNGDENAHFCLVNTNNCQETVIGRSNDTKLISTDGLLTSTYYGDDCSWNRSTKYRVNVLFNCDYTRNKRAEVETSETNCVTNVTIHTNEACADPKPVVPAEQCSTFVNTSNVLYNYNISRLMLTDRNYEIQHPNDTRVTFVLNVCQPILLRAGTHCDPTAVVCMRNDSVADLYKKSKTVAHYGSSQLTVLQNDSLLIQFSGSMCAEKIGNNYGTTIEFICDHEASDSRPILVSETDCDYYFIWRTQYACPLTNDTLQIKTENPKEETVSTESATLSNTNTQESSVLKMEQMQNESHVTSTLPPAPPRPDSNIITNKVVAVTEPPKILSSSFIVPIDVEVSNTSGLSIRNCTYADFNLYTLPRNINITSKTGKIYSLNICNLPKTHDCKKQNCLSGLKMDASNKFVEMDFHGITKCDEGYFNSVIYMKCSEKSSQPSVIKEEACGVEVEWKNSAVCALLQEKPKIYPNAELNSHKSGHITTIIISVFVLLLILCFSVFIFIYFWRKRQLHDSPSCLSRCDYSKIKDAAKVV